MAEQENKFDARLDGLLGQLKQRQDAAISGLDLAAGRRRIMQQLAARPIPLPVRPMVIRVAFGSVAVAAAAVLLVVIGLQFMRQSTPPVTGAGVAQVEVLKPEPAGGEVMVSLVAPEPQQVAERGAAVHYRRIRDYEQPQLQEEHNMAQVPVGAVLMIGTAKSDMPFLE